MSNRKSKIFPLNLKIYSQKHKVLPDVLDIWITDGNTKCILAQIDKDGYIAFDLGWNEKDLLKLGLPLEKQGDLHIPVLTGPVFTDKEMHRKLDKLITFVGQFRGLKDE